MWPPDYLITEEEYLVREPEAEYKSEYLDGRVTRMQGASRAHIVLVTNLTRLLYTALPETCTALATDMRVKVAAARFYTYPDIAVICGAEHYLDETQTTLLNPDILIEVLSPSTESYDRGDKFGYYQKLPSLREYVLVAQDRVFVEQYVRHDGLWSRTLLTSPNDSLALHIGSRVALSDVYRKVL
jgi:Uma2 family endonuclease